MDNGTVERERVSGRLEVRNLTFQYPGTDSPVLHDISFIAEPGQMVALVGRSGSGKSTLASLVPRFYHHEQGISSSMALMLRITPCATCAGILLW